MSGIELFYYVSDRLLVIPFLLMLIGSVILSFKMRFVQIRMIPRMFAMLFSIDKQQKNKDAQTILPHKALFTAMSTTIGIGNLTGPIIAMGLGGPGALVGFVFATLFGAATTFVEVNLALTYRTKERGILSGGPMYYLTKGLGSFWGTLYAFAGCILLIAWSSAQSNTLAVLLEPHGISKLSTGFFIAVVVMIILFGGIQRIATINELLVPFMFVLYCGASFWILFTHAAQFPKVFALIYNSFFSKETLGGVVGGWGMYAAMRHGLARGFNANEAGIGTATFPHSIAATDDIVQQGILAMVSVYANGVLCLLTGLLVLVTGVVAIPGQSFDITMLSRALEQSFPAMGSVILIICSILFAFGTILGNAYNGSRCFLYLTKNRWVGLYYIISAVVVFLGTTVGVKFVWTLMDFLVLPVAVPHMIGIVILAFTLKNRFKTS